jgi:pimeloyl-ACP methyl ester carboxylesterase
MPTKNSAAISGYEERVIQRATHLVAELKAEIVPNANHCAQYTAPEVVNKRILDFFADRETAD